MDDQQLTQLLQDLVRIPSVNPSGDPGTTQTGEAGMVDYLAEYFRKLALDVEVQEVEPGRANLIGKFTSRGSRRSIAFAPHTDTVSIAGMTIDPFSGEVRDGKLYGRGASDTKGSLAAFLGALTNLVRRKDFREGDCDVYLCALMGEESGNHGARALAQRGFRPNFLIAGEPTGCCVVHAHKGAVWLTLTTRGRTAHGSTPHLGESAIARMVEVLQRLDRYAKQLEAGRHPVLGQATINIGRISGGSATNIVPNHCAISVDRRLVPGETAESVVDGVRRMLGDLPVELAIEGCCCGPMFTAPDNAFVQQLAHATELPEPLTSATWFCDAAIFAEQGVPAVAFGPGQIAQAHTPDEFIELAEVQRAARIVERFLTSN